MSTLIAARILAEEHFDQALTYWEALHWAYNVGLVSHAEMVALEQQAEWMDADERDLEEEERIADQHCTVTPEHDEA